MSKVIMSMIGDNTALSQDKAREWECWRAGRTASVDAPPHTLRAGCRVDRVAG